ncbi:MAG: ABC transporter permease subunit [Eubacteriales bacterium]|nr:ABC transporter permease subunit [Eubacteriales bacterium]
MEIAGTRTPRAARGLRANFRKYWPYYVMALPGVVYLIIFKFVPMLGCVIAFEDYQVYKGIFGSDWVGLKNFRSMFAYSDFSRVLTNTLLMGLYRIVFTFPVPVILALMMNELGSPRLKKCIQTAVYIPYFLSWIIVAELIFDFLGVSGLFNRVRALLGMRSLLVMQQSKYFRTVYVISTIWKEAGWGTVVYMAAIAGIDQSLYEAASIDGATRWQKIRFITFPLIVPTALTLLLLQIGSFMELGFEHVYSLLTPMTYSTGDIFDTYVYRVGILQAQYSITTAVGLFQSVIGLVLVVFFNQLSRKVSEDGGLW